MLCYQYLLLQLGVGKISVAHIPVDTNVTDDQMVEIYHTMAQLLRLVSPLLEEMVCLTVVVTLYSYHL